MQNLQKKQNKQKHKVVTFGELMMRLSPVSGIRLEQAAQLDVNFGGAEANVAVCLARFGIHACHVTALPDNNLGESALRALRMNSVDTQFVLRKGARLGLYFLEYGSGSRPSRVIYDRADSSFSRLKSDEIDWEQVLEHASWFHWTGITPALGDSVEACLRKGLETAKKQGITVSVDLNYRKKLWSDEKAKAVMEELMPYVDVLIGNEEDPTHIFGISPEGTNVDAGRLNRERYKHLAEKIVDRYGVKKVAITLRESVSASENVWSACLLDGKEFYLSPKHKVWIIDRVGTGDAFAAGLIYGLLEGKSDPESLSLGVAAACLKHSIHGDFALIGIEEVERLSAGEKSGRIQR
jgi:2-dehydro-3-deoxygluconokinase